jgi:hypothetical protein
LEKYVLQSNKKLSMNCSKTKPVFIRDDDDDHHHHNRHHHVDRVRLRL